jgi:predicted ATPase
MAFRLLSSSRLGALTHSGCAGSLLTSMTLSSCSPGGRRSALPRHRTMRAALDWGHDLLPERERAVLRRLAIFAGSFTLEAASAVAASTEIADAEVVGCVANLVAKSLTAAEVGGEAPCYRLLETTRAYALEKLADSGELEQVERRYTDYSRGLVQRTEVGWGSTPAAKRLAGCGRRRIDAAQEDWAFSPAGDALIGGALMDGSVPAR